MNLKRQMQMMRAVCFIVVGLAVSAECKEVQELAPTMGKARPHLGLEGRPKKQIDQPFMKNKKGDRKRDVVPNASKFAKLGWPKQKALKGPEAKHFLNRVPKISTAGTYAEDPIFPGGGRMNAKDISMAMRKVGDMLKMADKAKVTSREISQAIFDIRSSRVKKLIETLKKPAKGLTLMSGAIGQNLGVQHGNLARCTKKLKTCRANKKAGITTELGEGYTIAEEFIKDKDLKDIKHTAVQEDRISRNDHEPDAAEKAKSKQKPYTQVKHTALQKYINGQKRSPFHLFPNQPGLKYKHDRMTAKDVHRVKNEIDGLLVKASKMEDKENERSLKKVKKAAKLHLDAIKQIAVAKDRLSKAGETMGRKEVLAELAKTTNLLQDCLETLQRECNETPTVAKAATPLPPLAKQKRDVKKVAFKHMRGGKN
jgi:hypothetical protein